MDASVSVVSTMSAVSTVICTVPAGWRGARLITGAADRNPGNEGVQSIDGRKADNGWMGRRQKIVAALDAAG